MGRSQHNLQLPRAARSSRLQPRSCPRKGCGRVFQPRRPHQRYCRDPACLQLVRRWQNAKRQQQRRSRPEVRQQCAAAERKRRAERRAEGATKPLSCRVSPCVTAAAAGAWSRTKRMSGPICDRPGCHDPPRPSRRCRSRYCSDQCREVTRRVRDRERKWLRRKTAAGRFKRSLEYQARWERRRDQSAPRGTASARDRRAESSAVLGYQESSAVSLTCGETKEVPIHDSQTPAGARPRAPPTR